MERRLRFADLQAANLVTNRVTLKNWIHHLGFPPGQLTGPNTRTWGEGEIKQWIESRPTASKPMPRPEIVRRGRRRKDAEVPR
jgi:predicted DNA-binding transcriptional regulator AlpA